MPQKLNGLNSETPPLNQLKNPRKGTGLENLSVSNRTGLAKKSHSPEKSENRHEMIAIPERGPGTAALRALRAAAGRKASLIFDAQMPSGHGEKREWGFGVLGFWGFGVLGLRASDFLVG